MTYLYIDPLGTTTLLSTISSLDETLEGDDLKSTAIMGITTTLTSSLSSPASADLYYTDKYIDSLTDTELAEMSELLNQKENQIIISEEQPKVYQKTINT